MSSKSESSDRCCADEQHGLFLTNKAEGHRRRRRLEPRAEQPPMETPSRHRHGPEA